VLVRGGSIRENRGLAPRWCAQANHRRRSHGDDTTPTTCARQGTETGGRQAGKCARRGSVLTRLLAKERQGLGSTVACSVCGCRRQTGARRHTSNQGTTQLQGKGARAAMTGAAPASDRLGSMTGSQAMTSLRGGASRQRETYKQRAHKARSSLGSKAGSTTRSRGLRLTLRSWTRRRGGGDGFDEGGSRIGAAADQLGTGDADVRRGVAFSLSSYGSWAARSLDFMASSVLP
jgi:hypothetical protein